MPTYEYICNACGHEFEKFQSIMAAPVKDCPTCGKKKAQRKISVGAGFIFKGSGFYETDYRNESYKKAAEADKAPSTETKATETKSDGKSTESKPAETKSATPAAEVKPPTPAKLPTKATTKSKRK